MRNSKDVKVAISKDVWMALERAHSDFADKLQHLLSSHGSDSVEPLREALRVLAKECSDYASICRELETQVKKGRPRVKPTPKIKTRNALLAAALSHSHVFQKRPGPPSTNGPKFDRLTFKAVEDRRKELAETNTSKPTIKAAIDSLNAESARLNSKREATTIKKHFERIHSAYKRGKKLPSKKSKPII